MQEKIKNKLFEMADQKYQEFHSGLCPGTNNILGIRVPVLRQYAKELIKQGEWKQVLDWKETDYYEEVMLQGMIIGLAKMSLEETLKYLKEFVPKIDNWAICDITCAGLKITKKYPKEVWNFIQSYINSDQEFEVRFALVMMLDFFLTEEYIDEILQILDNIKQEGYYVKMAMAWLISVAYVKFSKKTLLYLKKTHLDNFTYHKAIQKIIESNRIEKIEKEKIKKMKRRN